MTDAPRSGERIVLMLELTRGEQATLDRALRMYAAFYQDLAGREKNPVDKADLLAYVAAAGTLGRRIRPDLAHPAEIGAK